MANQTTNVTATTTVMPVNVTTSTSLINATATTTAMPVNITAPTSLINATVTGLTNITSTTSSTNETVTSPVSNNITSTTTPSAAVDLTPTIIVVVLTLIALAGLALNILVIIIFARVKNARKRVFYFTLELAIFDCIAVALWTVMSLIIAGGIDLAEFCHVQAYVMSVVSLVAMYTLFIINFERCVKLVKPSKHYEIFGGNRTVTFVVMFTVFIYCFTIAIFPLLGFGKIALFSNQFQCSWSFDVSLSHQNFLFIVGYVFPFLASIACQIICVLKAKKISAQVQPGETIILEENKDVPKMTYAEKLKKMENKFKYSSQPKTRKSRNRRKHKSNDSSSSSDSDEENSEKYREKQKRRRHYKFRHDDFKLAVTFIVLTSLHFLCWLPYFIVGYIWIIPGYSTISNGVIGFVTCLCHFTTALKPIVYLTNARYRSYVTEAFRSRKKDDDDDESPREKHMNNISGGDNNLKPHNDSSDNGSVSRRSSVSSGSKVNSSR